MAVVTAPTEDGAEFAVVDSGGTLFSDVLPFVPNHRRIGRSADGSVLVGFADLRLNSRVFRAADTPEPLLIYIDRLGRVDNYASASQMAATRIIAA